jgi:hypothetical protein
MTSKEILELIYGFRDDLRNQENDIAREIAYNKGLVELNIKHNKYTGDVEDWISKLEVKKDTTVSIIDDLNEVLDEIEKRVK